MDSQKAVQENAPATREVWCAQPDAKVEEHVMNSCNTINFANLTVQNLSQLLIQTMIFSLCCTKVPLRHELPF